MSEVVSVSQLNRYIGNMFLMERNLKNISVKGEVSNCNYNSSGHIYFTIKDSQSQIPCTMFKNQQHGLSFRLKEGLSVIVTGNVSVYERGGRYQLNAVHIAEDGTGKLYEEYEKLKKRLQEEGLFDSAKKNNIPRFAKKIGIVTSPTGAVIQDIMNVASRRNPFIQLILYPAKVQGDGAAQSVIEGIKYFENTDVDTVIIGRGGGSIEDLWAFNEEALARVIAACKKPVISAVGHETDTTIADFAADLRAPTPSAAAELAVYDYLEFEGVMRGAAYTLNNCLNNKINYSRVSVDKYQALLQKLSPEGVLNQRRMQAADIARQLQNIMENRINSARHKLALYAEEMKGLSPLYKLKGGFSYVEDADGSNIVSVKQVKEKDRLIITVSDGKIETDVTKVTEGSLKGE